MATPDWEKLNSEMTGYCAAARDFCLANAGRGGFSLELTTVLNGAERVGSSVAGSWWAYLHTLMTTKPDDHRHKTARLAFDAIARAAALGIPTSILCEALLEIHRRKLADRERGKRGGPFHERYPQIIPVMHSYMRRLRDAGKRPTCSLFERSEELKSFIRDHQLTEKERPRKAMLTRAWAEARRQEAETS